MSIEEIIFNPAQLFHEISDNFIPLAIVKHLELKSNFSEELNGDYKGDALRIRQIITNILSNAVKYTPSGGIHFYATYSSKSQRITIQIEDTGSGMTPEEQKIIFQEFARLTSHSAIEGTGLGLTITLKLIHLLGGEIHLKSEPGKGSHFTIILPLKQSTPTSEVATSPSHSITQTGKLNILLVDDDPLQLEMTAALLESRGIQTEMTTHPEEVADKLSNHCYDLVFSDIQMPEMNGFELVKQIRNLSTTFAQTLPVIALSADSGKKEEDYLQAGFTGYLGKPFTSTQLIQLITRLTGTEFPEILPSQVSDDPKSQLTPGYTLRNILQFTDNDPNALDKIIKAFITDSQNHIGLLRTYLEAKQWESIIRLAHKMLPIFRQLEAAEIIGLLEKLERADETSLTEEKTSIYIQEVISRVEKLVLAISRTLN